MNTGSGGFEVATSARLPQQSYDRLDGQDAPGRGRGGGGQHGHGVTSGQVIEGRQGRRVELAQHRAQLVGLPLPGPDQVLVTARENLHRLGQLRIPRDLAVMRPIQPDDLGQHMGITPVGFRPEVE
jgi:hypothetical protein